MDVVFVIRILPPQPHEEAPVRWTGAFFILFRKRFAPSFVRVMRPTSGARWEKRAAAAGGRCRRPAFTAAVEKCEDQRKPEAFFGHRKAARCDNPEVVGSNPSLATTKKTVFVEKTVFS